MHRVAKDLWDNPLKKYRKDQAVALPPNEVTADLVYFLNYLTESQNREI